MAGEPENPPNANTGVAQASIYMMVAPHNKIRAGRGTSSDYATTRTALSLLAVHWQETGVHAWANAQLKRAVAENPRHAASEEAVDHLHRGLQAYGSTVTKDEVRRFLTPDERSRAAALAFLGAPNALERLEQMALARLLRGEQGGNTPAVVRTVDPNQARTVLVQSDNTAWYLGWAGLYIGVVGIACPPCLVAAGLMDLAIGIVAFGGWW